MTCRTARRLSVVGVLSLALVGMMPVAGSASPRVVTAPPTSQAGTMYYLSLGDSLAQGFQPGFPGKIETLNGYSDKVVSYLTSQRKLVLKNFGCGGETSGWMLTLKSCAPHNRSLNSAIVPGETPMKAVLKFINAHRGHIGLITIAIGANDVVTNTSLTQTVANIKLICSQLRLAVGKNVPMVGIGYDDPELALWLQGSANYSTVTSSIQQIRNVMDPALMSAYQPSHVTFVDIAKDFQTYVPWTTTMTLAPYGTIPVAVARICAYTWMCAIGNVHPTTLGYGVIASVIVGAYRQITHLPVPRGAAAPLAAT